MERRTQNEIAAAIGVSVPMVSYLMAGKRRPSWELAKRLSDRFGHSPSWWMEASAEKMSKALRSVGGDDLNGSEVPNGKRRAA